MTASGSLWAKVNPREAPLDCVVCDAADGVRVWNAALHETVQAPPFILRGTFAGSRDDKVLAGAGPQPGDETSEIWVWLLPRVTQIHDVNARTFNVELTPDASTLVANFSDQSIRVWGPAEGKFLGCLAGG